MSSRTLSLDDRLYDYLLANSLREPAVLAELRAETGKMAQGMMQISPEQGQFMQLLARLVGAKRCIEIGTFTGYSSLAVALALPADGRIKAVAYARFSSAFRRALVVVHHGGVGTTAQALAAGRPMLVTPMAHDQFDNAARVARLGVGEGLPFAQVTVPRLVAVLAPLAHEPRYAAAAASLAPRIAAEDGAERAADLIAAEIASRITRR